MYDLNSLVLSLLLYNCYCCHGYQVREFEVIVCFYCHGNYKHVNNFPKNNICSTTFLISIKNGFYTIVVVAIVTKFKNSN